MRLAAYMLIVSAVYALIFCISEEAAMASALGFVGLLLGPEVMSFRKESKAKAGRAGGRGPDADG